MLDSFNKKYIFTTIKFVPDLVTGEFVNIGVLIWSKEEKFLGVKLINSTKRITHVFPSSNGRYLNSFLKSLKGTVDKIQLELEGLDISTFKAFTDVCSRIFPFDDGSLQWGPQGTGLSNDLNNTLSQLYKRLVISELKQEKKPITDNDTWKIFSKELKKRNLISYLKTKTINSDLDEITFKHAWKNGIWHCIEPVSFDLHNKELIKSKARKFAGQMYFMKNSNEQFKMYFLLSKPRSSEMIGAFEAAKKMLEKVSVDSICFTEDQIDIFADQLQEQILKENNLH